MSVRILRHSGLITTVVLALSGLAVGFTGRAFAEPRTRAVSGQAQFQLAPGPGCTSPFGICTTGTISGDLRGTLAGTARSFVVPADASVPSVASYINRIVIHTEPGDLTCTEVGGANTAGDGEFAGLCEITGGSGRLAGATGYLLLRGTFNPAAGGAYRYDGRLTLP